MSISARHLFSPVLFALYVVLLLGIAAGAYEYYLREHSTYFLDDVSAMPKGMPSMGQKERETRGAMSSYLDVPPKDLRLRAYLKDGTLPVKAGEMGILILGDSTSELAYEPYSVKLEGRYRTKSIPVRVLNAAMGGVSTEQEVDLFAQRYADLPLRVIVLGFCVNDPDWAFVRHIHTGGGNGRSTPDAVHIVRIRTRIAAVPGSALLTPLLEMSWGLRAMDELLAGFLLRIRMIDQVESLQLGNPEPLLARSFERLAALAKRAHVIIVYLPVISDLPADRARYDYVALVKRLSDRQQFVFLDMSAAFSRLGEQRLRVSPVDRFHFNDLGHIEIAEALWRAIEQGRMLGL